MNAPRHARAALHRGAALACAAALAVFAGCAGPPSRSGDTAPIELRIVYGNSSGSVGSDVIDALAKPGATSAVVLRNLSPAIDADAVASPDAEGLALAHLAKGEADLTIVRAGRLALDGADSLAVLEAPMVVTNDEQARRIAADPLALDAATSLERIGLVGVAIVPGSLRHLFGYRTAIGSPSDLRGTRISMKGDAAMRATAAALGATPDERVGSARSAAAASGALRAIDASLDQAAAVDLPAVVVSGLPIYEKFDVVVVRKAIWDGFSAVQRSALRSRVRAAVDRALNSRPGEEASLADWCSRVHASAVTATPEQRAAFHAVLDPVAERLAAHGEEALLSRMRALHDGTTDPVGTTCTGGTAPSRADLDLRPVGDQTVLDGTWRADATPAALTAAGGAAQDVANNAGIWTFHITNGRASVEQPAGPDCTMRLTFAGERVRLDMAAEGNDHCGGLAIGTWRRTGDVAHFVWTADVDGNPRFDEALFGTLTRTGG